MTALGFCGDACGWKAEDCFNCPWCERMVCYCEGAQDDTPALCNDCAARLGDDELGGRTLSDEEAFVELGGYLTRPQ